MHLSLRMLDSFDHFWGYLIIITGSCQTWPQSYTPYTSYLNKVNGSGLNSARKPLARRVLTHFDPALPVILVCDASPIGIGAVLSHVMPDGSERPVAFASQSLTKTERKYAKIDQEALSVVWGVKKFHVYLFGRRFTLVTDHLCNRFLTPRRECLQ